MPDSNRPLILQELFRDISSEFNKEIAKTFSNIDWNGLLLQALPKPIWPPIDFGGLDQQARDDILLMAKGGWYPQDNMSLSLIGEVARDIARDKYQMANDKMIDFFQQNYSDIKSFVLTELPERSKVLTGAFQAHERGDYLLSIPVFLIQADGVCFDAIKVQLYSQSGKKPKIAKVIDAVKNAGAFTTAMLSPLATNLPLTADSDERKKADYPVDTLNRHQILHGESTDYGTKANGFKTISLLSYICDVRQELLKNATP